MVAATAGRRRCAQEDGEAPGEVLELGTLVRLRANPDGPCYSVRGVLVEEHWGGVFTTHYRLEWVEITPECQRERSLVVSPASVFVHPADTPGAAAAEAQAVEEKHETAVVEQDDGAIRWCQVAANVDRSQDGRFEIEAERGGKMTARDRWTGEEVKGLAHIRSAADWCRCRLEAVRLKWQETPDGAWATRSGTESFGVRKGLRPGTVLGEDFRFGPGDRRRQSREFDGEEAARRWCEVRAMCVLEGPAGGERTLRYEPPIPF